MQKLLTITIDVDQLKETANGLFTVSEIQDINRLLEEGWEIEEWDFLTSEDEAEKAVILVILNDELSEPDFAEYPYSEEDDEEFAALDDEDSEGLDGEEEDEDGTDEEEQRA